MILDKGAVFDSRCSALEFNTNVKAKLSILNVILEHLGCFLIAWVVDWGVEAKCKYFIMHKRLLKILRDTLLLFSIEKNGKLS